MPRSLLVLLSLAALVVATPAAARTQVHFILSDDGPAYHAVVEAARAALGDATTTSVGPLEQPAPDAAVLVAVGSAAATRWAASDDPRPVFATLVPAAAAPAGPNRSALYLDQPLSRQLALIRVLLPPVRELGVVLGPTSAQLEPALRAAAERYGLHLHARRVDAEAGVSDAIAQVLGDSSVLLALPDPAVYNRYSVQAILLGSFRRRRPVIGFSESWVRAGALAAVYSRPQQLGAELGGMIAAWLADGGPLPPARAPRDYTLSVNRQVAFSLGLELPPDAVLARRLRALEAQSP